MALQAYMPALQGSLGIRRPRNKYRNVAESYLSYCKKRKRRASRTRMLKRRMIKLLEKLLCQRDGIHSEYGALLRYTQDYQKRLSPYAAEAVRVRCVAADSIYANNANRKFCTKYGISTSFVRKGRAAQDEPLRKVLRSELSKERATQLEGSFGTQKQHYSLARIKARNKKTEILWIFFGIHTANAILMINKIRNRTGKAA